ncbi:DUF3667 domain-containing protein [Urechidicola croceus]|uniref:DUF3667 domain-containing protein n=1 Tax=Urechidicola croceus TaxID=1850246 RepID=A0A1D8P8F4_9FLAO|nr:DUF3667 domain-containing protein [Urechidicola croceus]AOW20821.1 hypothetical protein LPB138_09085 [Urechidicola croceus]
MKLRKKKVPKLKNLECLNCKKPLDSDDIYCSYCGQKNVNKLSFQSFLNQLVSGLFSYDSRFWKTFIPLIFKPGKVSKQYIEGKRARFVNPFRLYLNVSILFFLILGISNKTTFQDGVNDAEVLNDSINNKSITTLNNGLKFSEKIVDSNYVYHIKTKKFDEISFGNKLNDLSVFIEKNPQIKDSQKALETLGYPITFRNGIIFNIIKNTKTNIKTLEADSGSTFIKKILSYLSIALFIFLPLFTLFLKLLYWRKKMNYMEHLVFVFHVQTVFFLLMIIFTLISLITKNDSIQAIYLLLFLVYLFIALRRFYGQGKLKTTIKFILLNLIYFLLGAIGISIVSAIALIA